jgi:hypothetical protein
VKVIFKHIIVITLAFFLATDLNLRATSFMNRYLLASLSPSHSTRPLEAIRIFINPFNQMTRQSRTNHCNPFGKS